MSTATTALAAPPRWRDRIVRVSPWVTTAIVCGVIFTRYPVSEIAAHLERGRGWPLLPLAMVCVLITLLMVATADWLVVRGCGGAARWFDVLRAKAGSSLLDILGYAAGHGAYAVWIARFAGCRAALAAGAMLYIVATDLLSVSAVAGTCALIAGPDSLDAVREVAPIIAGVLLLLIGIGPYRLLGSRVPVFEPWRVVPRRLGFTQAAIRIVHVLLWSTGTWVAARAFGLPIPWHAMVTYLPVALMVGALPVNVLGFGAVQAAWLVLFAPWAPATQILAFQILWTVAVLVAVVLRGLPFFRRVVSEVA